MHHTLKLAVAIPLALWTSSCASTDIKTLTGPAWAVDLAQADPILGGGKSYEERLELLLKSRERLGHKPSNLTGNPKVRKRFYTRTAMAASHRAMTWVQEGLTKSTAKAALQFFASPAGQSYAAAQQFALGMYPMQADTFPSQTAEIYADASRVGTAAKDKLFGSNGTQAALAKGTSVSPLHLSIQIAAMKVSAPHAEAIGTFFRSEDGKRYLQTQLATFPMSQAEYQEFRLKAIELKLVDHATKLDDLVLPKAK